MDTTLKNLKIYSFYVNIALIWLKLENDVNIFNCQLDSILKLFKIPFQQFSTKKKKLIVKILSFIRLILLYGSK